MSRRTVAAAIALSATLIGSLAACSQVDGNDTAAATSQTDTTAATTTSQTDTTSSSFYDSSIIHSIEVTVDQEEYEQMLQTYAETGDKDWISGTVVIDGVTFENVGLKLKGNSTLQGLAEQITSGDGTDRQTGTTDTATATTDATTETTETTGAQGPGGPGGGGTGGDISPDEPEGLPWRIRLDEFVDGQEYEGETDFVVRGNSTETSLDEAVALELLDASGLAAQQASATAFSVNGSEQTLRLVVQNPDDEDWYEENVTADGLLFKAQSGGDYSYRGTTAKDYADVFDLEANTSDIADEAAFEPLGEFLEFINESSDEDFSAGLSEYLDVEEFARYLAFEDLIGNEDDIDGPGNNSYLSYDAESGLMTVIAWDHNLAFGGLGGAGGPGGPGDMDADGEAGLGQAPGRPGEIGQGLPEGAETTTPDGTVPQPPTMPEGEQGAQGQPGGGGRGGNVLAERFMADPEFAALVDEQTAELQESLVDSGQAESAIAAWVAVLSDPASTVVDEATVEEEADAVRAALEQG